MGGRQHFTNFNYVKKNWNKFSVDGHEGNWLEIAKPHLSQGKHMGEIKEEVQEWKMRTVEINPS